MKSGKEELFSCCAVFERIKMAFESRSIKALKVVTLLSDTPYRLNANVLFERYFMNILDNTNINHAGLSGKAEIR